MRLVHLYCCLLLITRQMYLHGLHISIVSHEKHWKHNASDNNGKAYGLMRGMAWRENEGEQLSGLRTWIDSYSIMCVLRGYDFWMPNRSIDEQQLVWFIPHLDTSWRTFTSGRFLRLVLRRVQKPFSRAFSLAIARPHLFPSSSVLNYHVWLCVCAWAARAIVKLMKL